jgi:hypothetical protein
MLVFHAYINEMHGSRSKIPSKKSREAAFAEGFNSGVKGLMVIVRFQWCKCKYISKWMHKSHLIYSVLNIITLHITSKYNST